MVKHKEQIIVILGPTASGKSRLAFDLAKKHNGFIISADSRQIYKELDIITGKDLGEWKDVNGKKLYFVNGIETYMVDSIDLSQNFTLKDYQEFVFSILEQKKDSGQLPIIVGGTGLYISAIIENYQLNKEAPDFTIRKEIEKEIKQNGIDRIYSELLEKDPNVETFIDKNNKRRVIRALEYIRQTGKKFSEQLQKGESKYDFTLCEIDINRQDLYKKIEHRIDGMLENGGMQEAQHIFEKYGNTYNATSSIGYKQLGLYFSGEITKQEAIDLFKRDTRRYAKRQITWFSRYENIHKVKDYSALEKLLLDKKII